MLDQLARTFAEGERGRSGSDGPNYIEGESRLSVLKEERRFARLAASKQGGRGSSRNLRRLLPYSVSLKNGAAEIGMYGIGLSAEDIEIGVV